MTVIAFDGHTVAADRQASVRGVKATMAKLARASDGSVMAMMGNAQHGLMMFQWYENGCDPEKWPKPFAFDDLDTMATVAVFKKGMPVQVFEPLYPVPLIVLDKVWAGGCGRGIALGAMSQGANAQSAVAAAILYDSDCGMGIDSMEVDPS